MISTGLVYSCSTSLLILVTMVVLAPTLQHRFQIAPSLQPTFVQLVWVTTLSWSFGIAFGVFSGALEAVQPAAVDVNSGIEDAAGNKDEQQADAFMRICRNWSKLPLHP